MKIVLLSTASQSSLGSMARYEQLVCQAVSRTRAATTRVVRLPESPAPPATGSSRWRAWARHYQIMRSASRAVDKLDADVIHVLDGSYGYMALQDCPAPVVITVHDLIPLLLDRRLLPGKRPSLPARWIIRRSLRGLQRAAHLEADSRSTRDDLRDHAGISPSSISVVYSAAPIASSAQANNLAGDQTSCAPYILHVGHNAAYKNRTGVVRIFARVRETCDVKLVLAGGAPNRDVQSAILESGVADAIRIVVDPDDGELRDLYGSASLLLFPCLYEGAGWPPLEAMMFRCPVVCSSAASLPEMVGAAALMAAPNDEEALAAHCVEVLGSTAITTRLRELGARRVEAFTLESMGRGLLDVYERVREASSLA